MASEIEIRPLYEMEDFGDFMPGELREQEDHLARKLQTADGGGHYYRIAAS